MVVVMRTYRYCQVCKRNTYFEYDKLIEHGRCTVCKQGFGSPVDTFSLCKEQVINYLRKRLSRLAARGGSEQRIEEVKYLIEKIGTDIREKEQ